MKIGIVSALKDVYAMGAGWFTTADLSLFHDFEPPPTGGGHQFLRAFIREAEARGLKIENNRISRTTRACMFNSFNFDERRLGRLKSKSLLSVHRVDGPVDVYRGWDDGVDRYVQTLNEKFADRTILQSRYSLEKHAELGFRFRNPVVIMNAADPQVFHSDGKIQFSWKRKTRLIASAWSHNVNKGTPVYEWLDEHLDWHRYEMTFVGRSPVTFNHIRMIPAVDSNHMAGLFREHDIYITASKNDPCSNSLIEALACGLPAIHLQSGGHPEIVKQAGVGFEAAEQIPELLEKIINDYESFQSLISIPSIQQVTEEYLKVLELL
ncbi:MAG: glycosyltransferase family 1 protein [Chloroflexi bacterium CFX2]|nr:glycosyltransferase family 1 protein [Chloroflexi bacterium CFX2]